MMTNLTLVCPEMSFTLVADAVEAHANAGSAISGSSDQWTLITMQFPTGELRFTSLVQAEPGDRFSKLILSMHNFANRRVQESSTCDSSILSFIAQAEMLIGVVATPAMGDEDERFSYVTAISDQLNAIIFDGSKFLKSSGDVIL